MVLKPSTYRLPSSEMNERKPRSAKPGSSSDVRESRLGSGPSSADGRGVSMSGKGTAKNDDDMLVEGSGWSELFGVAALRTALDQLTGGDAKSEGDLGDQADGDDEEEEDRELGEMGESVEEESCFRDDFEEEHVDSDDADEEEEEEVEAVDDVDAEEVEAEEEATEEEADDDEAEEEDGDDDDEEAAVEEEATRPVGERREESAETIWRSAGG